MQLLHEVGYNHKRRGRWGKTDIWDISYLLKVAINFNVNLKPYASTNVAKLKLAIIPNVSHQKVSFWRQCHKNIQKESAGCD